MYSTKIVPMPCPSCAGKLGLTISMWADEIGDFSLAGEQLKFNVKEMPMLMCQGSDPTDVISCGFKLKGSFDGSGYAVFDKPDKMLLAENPPIIILCELPVGGQWCSEQIGHQGECAVADPMAIQAQVGDLIEVIGYGGALTGSPPVSERVSYTMRVKEIDNSLLNLLPWVQITGDWVTSPVKFRDRERWIMARPTHYRILERPQPVL